MNWKSEMDELRRREEFAEELGGPGAGQAAARRRAVHDPRAHRPARGSAELPRDRQDRREAPPTTRKNDLKKLDAVELRLRPGAARRAAGGRGRRRLHRARRFGGRHHQGQAQPVRADGQRAAPAADAHRRGVGRRRLGEDHRDDRAAPMCPASPAGSWWSTTSGTVPRVALGLGSVAGLGAAHLAAAHYSVMVKDMSALFVAGPPVVERLGQKLTKNELGGWQIQLRAGAVDQAVDTEEDAFACARRFLSYLPSSVYELPPRGPVTDDPERREEWLSDAIPRDIRARCTRCARSSRRWWTRARSSRSARSTAAPIITGLARIDGWPVAMMASDPLLLRRRVDRGHVPEGRALGGLGADLPPARGLPGGLPGLPHRARGRAARGTIKQGVRAMSAIWQTTVPWCAVIIRNVFGVAGAAHKNGGALRLPLRVAVGALGLAAARGRDRGGLSRRSRRRRRSARRSSTEIEERLNKLRSPFRSAETFWIEEIIDPREHAPAALRVRQPGRAPARAGAVHPPHAALSGLGCPPPLTLPSPLTGGEMRMKGSSDMAYKAFDLTGKTAIVTGGNSGIGLGMAEAMAQAGAARLHLGHQRGQERARARPPARDRGARPSRSAAT